jgi:hypothetical protein
MESKINRRSQWRTRRSGFGSRERPFRLRPPVGGVGRLARGRPAINAASRLSGRTSITPALRRSVNQRKKRGEPGVCIEERERERGADIRSTAGTPGRMAVPPDGTRIAVCHHRSLAAVTFMYCYPAVLESEAGRAAVDDTLATLASELELDGVRLRKSGGSSIIVRGIEPRELWQAMDRAVPDWEDRRLFFAPVFF